MAVNAQIVLVLLFFCTISAICAQDVCSTKEKCNECIRELDCVWCTAPRYNVHCKSKKTIPKRSSWCATDKLMDPQRNIQYVKEMKLNSGKYGDAVQITPQEIKLVARRGEVLNITFYYAKAADYPVDLYYIMDLSNSMQSHKVKLASLGDKLTEVMMKLTTNFRLGFGSFVDKPTMPYMSTDPKQIKAPCRGCVKGYGFRNELPLTENHHLFAEKVYAANVSGNLDAPEGGFDAIMQAIVCKDEIGWRPNARHIIIFSTDATFHVAGDGKLGGIVEPNDGTCHMVDNEYSGLDYDYPSVSFLNHVAKENNINLIFAVVGNMYENYESLHKNFESSEIGNLGKDSRNVVNLVEKNYKKIVESVSMTDNATSSVEIKYQVSCDNPKENGCSKLKIGEIVKYTATVKPLECRKGSNNHVIQIKPEGISETLILHLQVQCDCDCEISTGNTDYIRNAELCHWQGDRVCGVCNCRDGYIGSTCECHSDKYETTNRTNCMLDPATQIICSDLGICKCGTCICDKREGDNLISGKYCQCDNFSCNRVKNQLCNGPEHGNCVCGKCKCLAGWTGDDCDCRDTQTTCIAPGSQGAICSNRGECKCGECQCKSDEQKYSGRYCEECASCPGQRCQELKSCVQCQTYQYGLHDKESCKANCIEFNTTIVDEIDEETEDERIKICRVLDDAGCTITFQYIYDDEQMIRVRAERKIECPTPINVMAIIWGVIGAIVLGGLIILIIWKIVTQVHDGKEYAKFVQSTKNCKWAPDINPHYKPANTTYNNPAFKTN